MRIGIIGLNYKLADLKLRETLAKVCEKRFHPSFSAHGKHSFILLSTCNRTEIYFSSHDLAETHTYLLNILRQEISEDFDHKLYSFFGVECFNHLSRVTTGLDSASTFETEIQGQVKKAYELALGHLKLPSEIHYLFQKALNIGKHVRSQLTPPRTLLNLADAIYETGIKFFDHNPSILFVGASQINRKILNHLKQNNFNTISLMTRAPTHASHWGVPLVPFSDLPNWANWDWIICGTKSSEYLISTPAATPKLLMDLSVPRNIKPSLGEGPHTLLNIDDLGLILAERQAHLKEMIAHADSLISSLSSRHTQIYSQKQESKLKQLALIA
jgi:glutamyl-tRNA reductase